MQREEWLTIAEAAKLTERSPRTIRRWLQDGGIEIWRPGRLTLLKRADVLRVEKQMEAELRRPSFGRLSSK